jgi:hypothetical protein
VRAVLILAVAAVAVFVWSTRDTSEERAIRGRLETLRNEVNASTADGLGNATRAVQIGGFFTKDVVVELGEGSVPIRGRDTIVGMVARLQPRTAAFSMELDDISVELVPGGAADVLLTASFVRRSIPTGEESRDAREYALVLTNATGEWEISRITAIDTLR